MISILPLFYFSEIRESQFTTSNTELMIWEKYISHDPNTSNYLQKCNSMLWQSVLHSTYLPKAMEVKDDLIYYQPIWHLLVLTEPDLKNRILQKCYTVDFLRGMSDKFQVRLVARYIHPLICRKPSS